MAAPKHRIIAGAAALLLLTACGKQESADILPEEKTMTYIKTVSLYDTLTDMYNNPNDYLGKDFHMVGTLYPGTTDDGTKFYSVYTTDAHGDEGIGLELDWSDFSGIEDYDKITVEGKLDKFSAEDENGESHEYLILRCSSLTKREN